MRRYIRNSLLGLFIMLYCIPQVVFAGTDKDRLDAVLVIDASGSMKETDPNKLGLEGVKLFIDMMASTENQVGVVTYGAEADSIYPMTEVNSQDQKEAIKQFVDHVSRELEYTDITSGLKEALKMQEARAQAKGNSPLIIIFTDGNNAIGGIKNRTYEMIDQELDQLIEEAKKDHIPIYTIGLNDNGKLNEAYLKNISNQTDGLAFVTKTASELPDILTQIFAAHSHLKVQALPSLVGTGEFEEVTVNIPNNNVLEANISISSREAVTLRLTDAAGKDKSIPSQDISLHKSNSYELLKIIKPMAGDWKLSVKGAKGDQIGIDLVYNYDLEVVTEALGQTEFSKGDELKVSAYLSLQGKAVDDEALYQNATPTLILRDSQSGVETRISMTTHEQEFEGSYELKNEGNFELSVLVEDSSYQRESTPISIQVGKKSSISFNKEKAQDGSKPVMIYIGSGIGVLALLIGALAGTKLVKKVRKPLVGQVVIDIRDQITGKLTPPQYKKLNVFPGKVSLFALLQFAPEFKETEKIVFKSAPGDKVILLNHSEYRIEKSGRVIKADTGMELKKGDKLVIEVEDAKQTVQIEYLL